MGHLLFRPRPAGGPEFFLWGNEPGRAETGILERLAAFGRRAIGRVVTDHLRAEQVRGLRIALSDGVAVLAGLETADLDRVPASVAVWSLAAKLALDLVARERILPLARPGPGGVEARWGVSLALSDDAQRFTRLARAFPPSAHAVPVDEEDHSLSSRGRISRPKAREGVQVWAPEALLTEFLDATADTLVREAAARIPTHLPNGERGRWEGKFVAALTKSDPAFPAQAFLERGLPDEITEWVAPVRGALAANTPRVCLKLDSPPDGTRARTGRAWQLSYFLQAPDDPSEAGFTVLLPAELSPAGQRRLRLRMRVGGRRLASQGPSPPRGASRWRPWLPIAGRLPLAIRPSRRGSSGPWRRSSGRWSGGGESG